MTAPAASRPRLYLKLGRVSNLPTVATNTLAGVVLGGGSRDLPTVSTLAVALSLFYVGGMFLNDAFDRGIDARERPERPIPSGQIRAGEVFAVGFGLLGVGLALLVLSAARHGTAASSAVAGLVLGALIVLYDAWHKQNPFSPVVMGACRGAVYVAAALGSGGGLSSNLGRGALVVGAYVVGLTFVARQENRRSFRAGATLALIASPIVVAVLGPAMTWVAWVALGGFVVWAATALVPLFASERPNIPRTVVRLIAGVSLVDALLVAAYGAPWLAPLGLVGLLTTLGLQRWVRGT